MPKKNSTSQVRTEESAKPGGDATPRPSEPEFDLSTVRLAEDYASTIGVKQVITTVPVRKPDRQVFVRTHPSPEYNLQTAVLEDKENGETYLVERPLWKDLVGEIVPKLLITTISRQRVVSLWPIRLPGEDGRLDPWNESALLIAERAKKCWVRLVSNRALGAYEIVEAPADLGEPEWPDLPFEELVQIAFRDRIIRDLDHAALRRLRGEL